MPWKELGKKFTGCSAKHFCLAIKLKGQVHSDFPAHVALGAILARHVLLFVLQVQSSAAGLLVYMRNVWIGKTEKADKCLGYTRAQLSSGPWLEVLDISEQCLPVPCNLLPILWAKKSCRCLGKKWQLGKHLLCELALGSGHRWQAGQHDVLPSTC